MPPSVSALMRVIGARRSVRAYLEHPANDDQIHYIVRCVERFMARMQFTLPVIRVIGRGERFDQVIRAASSGLLGKISPWLRTTKAGHLLVCACQVPDEGSGVFEQALIQAAMTLQIAVLAATELGLGTCWIAGIDHKRVEDVFALPPGAQLMALCTLGYPQPDSGLSFDALAKRFVSPRRKPLDALWMRDRWSAS